MDYFKIFLSLMLSLLITGCLFSKTGTAPSDRIPESAIKHLDRYEDKDNGVVCYAYVHVISCVKVK